MSMLHNLKEHLIETSEQMIKVVEEGGSILLGLSGEANEGATTSTGQSSRTVDDPIDIFDDEQDIMNMNSPLNGIAEGVLGDIMKNQVLTCNDFYECVFYFTYTYRVFSFRYFLCSSLGSSNVIKRSFRCLPVCYHME